MRRRVGVAGPTNRQQWSTRRAMAHELPEYSIQEAAAKLGIPVQKLRRWDVQGVLVARRTDGGHRRYACEIIDRSEERRVGKECREQWLQDAAEKKGSQ